MKEDEYEKNQKFEHPDEFKRETKSFMLDKEQLNMIIEAIKGIACALNIETEKQ